MIAADRTLIAYRTATGLAVFDTATLCVTEFAPPAGATGFLRGGAFSPDGHHVLVFVAMPGRLGQAVVLDLDDTTVVAVGRLAPFGEDVGWATWDLSRAGWYFGISGVQRVDLATLDVADVPLTERPMAAVLAPNSAADGQAPPCPGATAQSTKGTMPSPPAGATQLDPATIPDFIGYVGSSPDLIGYVPSDAILAKTRTGGSTGNDPVPVCDKNLDRLIGYAHAGRGFVPLGTDPATVPTLPVITVIGRAGPTTSPR